MSEAPEQNLPGSGEQIKTGNNSPLLFNRITLPKDTRHVLLALSVLVNIALLLMYRYEAQERDLDRYDDAVREKATNKEIEGLKARVDTLDKVTQARVDSIDKQIQAYGLRKAIQEASYGRSHHHPK